MTVPLTVIRETIYNTTINKNYFSLLENGKSPPESGNEVLKNIINDLYVGEISIGTPPQKLYVQFNTGTGTLWVASFFLCKFKPYYCESHNFYHRRKSTTGKLDGRQLYIQYLVGGIKGVFASDNVSVGPFQIKDQLFLEASELAYTFDHLKLDGIFGLSFLTEGGEKYNNIDPPFINMIKQKVVSKPIFSFYFTDFYSTNNSSSELILGGVNKIRYTGEFFFTDVVNENYWVIQIDTVFMCKQKIGGQYYALINTGSSIINGPFDIIDGINKAIGGKLNQEDNLYYVDCDHVGMLPNITFIINDHPFPLRGQDYILKDLGQDGKQRCISGLIGFDQLDYFIFGTNFLRAYYTLFDVDKRRIGFAKAV